MEFASKFVERAIDFVLDLSVRQVGYIIYYGGNVSELKGLAEDLGHKKERVEHGVGEAKNNLGIIEGDVGAWLKEVDDTKIKLDEFQNDEGHTKTGFSNGLLPYLRNRHGLGRKAKKMAIEVKLLLDKSKFVGVSYQQNPTYIDASLSNTGYVEFGSRKSTMEKIMAKLEDSTVRMIGVHGPGGVGKSTLIKEIAKKAQDNKLFNVVVIVEITDNPNLQKIQEEIAYVLGLRLEGEGETVRADHLRRRLKKEKENTLVILDDLWDRLDLNKIGIPFDDDDDDGDDSSHMTTKDITKDIKDPNFETVKMGDPNFKMVKRVKSFGDYKGCKILLTSRDRKVLSDKMDVKSIFDVKELDYKDASMLFKKVAGIPDEMSNFQQEIVKKYCAGLPMAIVTVGRALRNKGESVWEATLEKLKKEELIGVHKSMEISVKLSYDHLESEELRFIFLLCAQMGHQPLIMHLVKYCFGLGILKGVYTLREARDRIYISIQKLKDSSLMLDGSSNDNFNMHDMVRDAALSIAHKEQNVFTLRNDKLDDWPDKDELEKCTAISIRNSDIIDELPEVINCPQLKFFQIDSDDPSLKIPERFFEGMKKLRVLILTGFHLTCLPSSIKCLSNLRMLCLERCTLVDNLSIIGELKKLRILSFSGSRIDSFPTELRCLDKLQLLDISDCFVTKGVPPNVISRLTCLEELYIRKSLNKMKVDGETNQISFLSQLKQLHQLKVVDLCIPCAAVLPKDLFFDKLIDYKIVIGDFKLFSVGDFKMPNKYEALRSLALQLKHGTDIHSQKGIMLLFRKVENLLLGELDGVQNVFYELNLDGFPDLKHLSITNNNDIEYIINSMVPSQNVFPNLESLCLYKLRSMKMICCSLVTDASFTKLKTIKVKVCSNLKNLFSFDMVKCVSSLETIDVSECDSLEVIVVKDGQANSDKVEFHNLRSLTLELLPSFTSFYTNIEMSSRPQLMEGQTTNRDHLEITIAEDEHSVFCELVELPKLESLMLSSINSYKIWSDQPLSCSNFQNLIKLVVKDCKKLRYLCSLSVASNLKKLKGLYISECGMMEKIFIAEGNNVNEVCIFPKLEEIHLTKLNMLTDIWPVEVSADSFSSLISVQIEWCKKLDKVFPGHMTGGWVRSLDSLKVAFCESVEVIFEIKDSNQIDASRMDTKLQQILLRRLDNLKQIWDRDPGGILNFKNLRNITVFNCCKLSYVLPASVAKDLERLENISIKYNDKIEEIVVWEDGSRTPLVFPEVTDIRLCHLPNIKRFYKSGHPIECPRLKRLIVHNCEKLETFTIETTNEERQPVFSVEKVISNLECMEIDLNEALWLRSNYGKYRMHGLKEFTLRNVESIELLYWFLHRMPNLERLSLIFPRLKELVPSENVVAQERLGTVLQFKALTLWFSNIKDLGFERDPVLQRLERLVLQFCRELINLAPSSVSLIHLTYLEVYYCSGLINLMSSSTAKSMVQLTKLKVKQCGQVKVIVTNEGNEEDGVIEVVFSKLISIELVALDNLTSFCSFKNCEFKFPSLERLIVEECPRLKIFTESHTSAPKLQSILAVEGEEEERRYWEGDLNSTIQKVYKDKVSFEYMDILDLSYYPELVEQVWHHNALVQDNIFHNLKTLRVEGCSNLVHAIPSHLLPCFENLEELSVRSCSAVQVIFNISDMRVTKALVGTFRLKSLSVERCNSLKSLFPPSVAKNLTRLEALSVTHCTELVEIISKDEIAIEEGATKEFVFPRLTSLELVEMPGLKYFYPGVHKLKWPALKELDAYHCDLAVLKCQDHPGEQDPIQFEKVIVQIPSLEKLSFGIGDTKVTWNRVSQEFKFDKMQRFQEESDSILYRFLVMLPNIERLELFDGLLEEMFSAEKPNADYTRVLLHLKELTLRKQPNLSSIGLEHSWLHPIPENLQSLKVYKCERLINLVPCTVSFSNLTVLEVSDCKGLLYLFTSSTAKSLAQLKEMKIEKCESMKEIVSTEGVDLEEDEKIIFGQLQTLNLEDLPGLRCFYRGNFTLCFPSLEQVTVIGCNWMKTFSPINKIDSTKFSSGATFFEDSKPQWESDLNSFLCKKFEEEFLKSATETSLVSLRDDPLQEIWHGSLLAPDTCFRYLKHLIVDGCQFLSEVLPSNLLPFFTKMKKLEVRNCTSVKTIFDVKCFTKDRKMTTVGPALLPLSFSLEELILEQLPNLENVTDADHTDPEGTNLELTFPCMTSLTLQELPQLKNFYCSLHCDMLKISTHQEPHTEDKVICIEKLTPNLQSLSLGEKELKIIWLGNLLHKLKAIALLSFHIESDLIPFGFLQQLPNIEKLVVISSSFKEIFCFQRPDVDYTGFLSQLKVLRLELLSELISIGLEHPWIEPFLKNLEIMKVIGCSRLRNLAVSPVCFSNLMRLSVFECHGLVNLFTSSTAKSLARLKKMKISCCKSMQEIVSTEVDETEKDEKVIFGQLQTLDLYDLPQLRCFYSGNFALCFPSLENVTAMECCWLKTFAPINIIDSTKLSIEFEFLEFKRHRWEGDLNSVVRQSFEEQILESAPETSLVSLRDDPLQEIWHGSLPAPYRCFSKLVHLIVNGCQFLSKVLPSNLLPFFTKMKKLEVRNCDYVKTIFDVKCVTEDRKMTTVGPALLPLSFSLEELILEQLPNLENVWNEDPQGILRVQLLQEVHVDDCKCLTSLFPVSVAKDLVKLEKLAVKNCKGLITIVIDDDHADPKGTNLELTFPCMTSLTLQELPQLKNFYCSLHCDMLKISTDQEPHTEDKVICIEKLTPNLMGLSLGEKNLAASFICFSNLTHLFVSECHGLVNLFTSSTAKSLARLKKMEIFCCKSMQEIVSREGDESHEDEQIIFEQLQCLYLKDLPELKCFYPGNFTLCFSSLEQVSLINCHKIEIFCPGSMNADKLLGVNFQDESDAVPLKIDLNSTVGKAFLAMDEYAIPSEIDLNSTI